MNLSNEALEAAAVAAENWDPGEHGKCTANWFQYGEEPYNGWNPDNVITFVEELPDGW